MSILPMPPPPSIKRSFTAKHAELQKNLQKHWKAAKRQFGKNITQGEASLYMGIRQPTVCQYLTGTIALNKEIILLFVNYLRSKGYSVTPGDIDPELKKLIEYQAKVFVLSTYDRKTPSTNFINTDSIDSSIHCYAIELENNEFALVSPEHKVVKNSLVCVALKNRYIVGKLLHKDEENIVIHDTIQEIDSEIPVAKIITLHKTLKIVPI